MRLIRSAALVAVAVSVTLTVTSGVLTGGNSVAGHGRPAVPPRSAATARLIAQNEPTAELKYVPLLTPCRVANSTVRPGALAAGKARQFQIAGSTGVSTTGGPAAGCGVPLSAQAVGLAVTAFRSYASGDMVAYAAGNPRPITRTLSLIAGKSATASGPVGLGRGAYRGAIIVVNRTAGSTDLVLDVTGYYIPQIHGLVYGGSVYSGSSRILSSVKVSTGVYDVTVDTDVAYCTATTTAYYDRYYYTDARMAGGRVIRVYSWYLDSNTHEPKAIDNYVFLTVTC